MSISAALSRHLTVLALLTTLLLITTGCADEAAIPKHIGIVLFGDSRQPQVDGFRDGLGELGYEEDRNVTYTVLNAENKRDRLTDLVSQLQQQDVDLLVAAGGLEADTMKHQAGPDTPPVVVLYVNAIVERGLVQSRRQAGWPVTGVDNLNAELSGKRVQLLHDLLPAARRILILYYQRIAPSRIGVEHARRAAEDLGLTIDARAVNSRDEIRQVMTSLQPGDVDAMLTVPTAPIDNALKSIILPEVSRLQLPMMTHSRPLAEAGALASYGAPFYDLGKQTARLGDKVLRGISPDKIPFENPKTFVYSINRPVMETLGIELNKVAGSQVNEYLNPR